jgi:uncharacterized membrane protein YkoI
MAMGPIRRRQHVLWRAGGVVCTLATMTGVHADDADYERARRALERGDTRPLSEILERVARYHPGEVVGVGFDRSRHHGHENWVYELKILAADGRLEEIHVDGATARILDDDLDGSDT